MAEERKPCWDSPRWIHCCQCCGLMLVLLIGGTAWGASSNLVSAVRSALTAVTTAMPDGRRRTADYLYEFGYKYRSNPHYVALATIVSNDLQAVNADFHACATNELNRLILLSTAWAFGDDYYLNCISNDLELVEAGVLSKKEFLWARKGSRNIRLLGLMPMEYSRLGVSNLVLRMQQVIGETNYCQRILSGEARTVTILIPCLALRMSSAGQNNVNRWMGAVSQIRGIVQMAGVLIVFFACVCGYGDAVSDVRLALDHVTSKLDSRRNLVGMYLNYGIPCSTNSEYRALAVAVSNQWQAVLGDLSQCATNQLERLLVLGVRDRFDENFFYDYVEGVFDQWQTGMVSTVEFQWVRHSERPGFDCLFERRYKVERVRRLIQRFERAETNNVHWQKVLSGEAYTNYLEEVSAGMWR